MALFRLDPITRKRFARFRRIKRGYYSLLTLLALTFISLFSNYIANDRPIALSYRGKMYFPTYTFYQMDEFGQMDAEGWGITDQEAEYGRLKDEWAALEGEYQKAVAQSDKSPAALKSLDEQFIDRHNWILMPPIPWDPYQGDFWYTQNANQPPPNAPDFSRKHYIGTDSQGRDIAARLLYGFRTSIFFALILVLITELLGTIIGCLQGFIGGKFDMLTQRVIEVWSALPFLYFVILLATFFTPTFWKLLGILVLFQWISITYYMRTELYREKTKEYCLAAQSYGASRARIIFRHLLPNCLTPLVTFVPFAIVGSIFALTSLDYLGFGLPAPTPSWGELIDQGMKPENRDKLWLVISPFISISVTLVLVTFVGESVREAFDPKQYARYE